MAIADADILTTININGVAVGVNFQVVEGEIVRAGGQNGEPSTTQYREIADDHVSATQQADGFVGGLLVGVRAFLKISPFFFDASRKVFSVDETSTGEGDIFKVASPNQTILEVAVSIILVFIADRNLGFVVIVFGTYGCGDEGGTMVNKKRASGDAMLGNRRTS